MDDGLKREIVAKLRAPAYWMSGSSEGHEGENDIPFKAADLIEAQASALQRAVEALEKIARLRTGLSGDFSMASKQSDIAREALTSLESGPGQP